MRGAKLEQEMLRTTSERSLVLRGHFLDRPEVHKVRDAGHLLKQHEPIKVPTAGFLVYGSEILLSVGPPAGLRNSGHRVRDK